MMLSTLLCGKCTKWLTTLRADTKSTRTEDNTIDQARGQDLFGGVAGGRLQIADFGVDRCGVVHDQPFLVLVELVLGLARHRKRAGEGDLDVAVGVGPQELDIVDFDRPQPPDQADDARHHDGAAGTPAHGRRVFELDPRERGRKTVRVAFARWYAPDMS
jgi:hypothetical protein